MCGISQLIHSMLANALAVAMCCHGDTTNQKPPGKTWHITKILKIVIAHLHDTTTHDLAAARFWKQSTLQFFRYDVFYSPVSAILESRNCVLNTLRVGSLYTPASCTSEHVWFVKNQLTKTRATAKGISAKETTR